MQSPQAPISWLSSSRSDYAVGVNPSSVAAADFNHDGWLDLVVANRNGATLSLFRGNGDGAFQALTGSRLDKYVFPETHGGVA
jgi:hypothetical protein